MTQFQLQPYVTHLSIGLRAPVVAVAVLALSVLLANRAAFADGSPGDESATDEISRQAEEYRHLIENGDAQAAVIQLEKLRAKADDNADVHNALGYGYRHLRRFDEALAAYRLALFLMPGHPGANEYLGELYLLLDRPNLAKERLAVLANTCPMPCEAHAELAQAIQAYAKK